MKLYVYADESGAFDKVHNDIFVYGGVVLVGADAKADAEHRYAAMESRLRKAVPGLDDGSEIKASRLDMKSRKRMFTSLERPGRHQFAVIVDQKQLRDEVFDSKKRKQRYLDYALKRGVKSGILDAMKLQGVGPGDVDAISVVVDEHSTSTDGKYNLAESIDEELRCGMFSPTWRTFHPPVFGTWLPKIPVSYVDSSKVAMVRAADVTANWAFMAERDKGTYPRAYEMLSKATVLRLP